MIQKRTAMLIHSAPGASRIIVTRKAAGTMLIAQTAQLLISALGTMVENIVMSRAAGTTMITLQ